MTFATEKARVGNTPVQLLELDRDVCSLTYGSAPCTASGSAGSECYNTRSTCQDPANYTKTTVTDKFCEEDAPRAVIAMGYIPAIKKNGISRKPTKIEPYKGMPLIGSRSISLLDFTHHDRGMDPYYATRTSAPQGTYWGRWLARNKYWIGRSARVIDGYLTDDGELVTRSHYYVIEKFEGPNKSGVRITVKDPLKLADGDRANIPVKTTGAVANVGGISDSATSVTVSTDTGTEYATYRGAAVSASNPGYIRINDEYIKYESVTTDTLGGLTRGQWGTTAAAHSEGDDVQKCWHCENENVVDLIEEIWQDFTELDTASYIPSADWAAEKANWLSSTVFTGILGEPESVRKVLEEMCRDAMINVWWNDEDQEVKLKSIIPDDLNTATVNYTDAQHLIRDSVSVKQLPDKRVSRVYVFYKPTDWTNIEQDDMAYAYAQVDATGEDADHYGQSRIMKIVSRWIPSIGLATQLAGRTLARLKDDPIQIEFTVHAKDDDLKVGESKTISTERLQDVDGAALPTRIQILERQPTVAGAQVKYLAQNLVFAGRYAFIAPDGTPDYSSATDEQKAAYGFISEADGTFSDGTEAYKIL